MNKKIISLLLFILTISFLSCGEPQVKESSVPTGGAVGVLNKQLEEATLDNFGYKSTKPPAAKWDKWASTAAPVVDKVLKQVPDGYVLQITGHADASGPEEPTGSKPGNLKISEGRAKAVYDALKKQGIDDPKLTYKGVGASELNPNYDERSAEQRRVTFVIIEK